MQIPSPLSFLARFSGANGWSFFLWLTFLIASLTELVSLCGFLRCDEIYFALVMGPGSQHRCCFVPLFFFFGRWVVFLAESICVCVPWLPLNSWWSSCFVSPVVEIQAHSTMLDLLGSFPDIFLLRQGLSVVQSGLACGRGWPWTQSFCCYLPSSVLEPCLYCGGLETPCQKDGVLQVAWVPWHFRLPLAAHWPPCQVC